MDDGLTDEVSRRSALRERASITLMAAAIIVVFSVLATFVVRLSVAANERARAQAAADAAALAGASDGRAGAASLASRNGGVLVGYAEVNDDVVVVVNVGDATAHARARHSTIPTVSFDPADTSVDSPEIPTTAPGALPGTG